jgi:hypothetical protein
MGAREALFSTLLRCDAHTYTVHANTCGVQHGGCRLLRIVSSARDHTTWEVRFCACVLFLSTVVVRICRSCRPCGRIMLRLMAAHVAFLSTSPERLYSCQLQNVYRNLAQLVGGSRVPTEVPCQHSLAGSLASNTVLCAQSARCAEARLFLAGSSHLGCFPPVRPPRPQSGQALELLLCLAPACGACCATTSCSATYIVAPAPPRWECATPFAAGCCPCTATDYCRSQMCCAIMNACFVRGRRRPLVMHVYVTPTRCC